MTSIKQLICRTVCMSFADASVICESLFKEHKAEISLFGNTFWQELISYGNQSIDSRCKSDDWFLCDADFFAGRYSVGSVGISPDFWVERFSLGARFLQIFGYQITRESAETVRFDGNFLAEGWVEFLYFARNFVISKQIKVLFFFVVFELSLSRCYLLKVDINQP